VKHPLNQEWVDGLGKKTSSGLNKLMLRTLQLYSDRIALYGTTREEPVSVSKEGIKGMSPAHSGTDSEAGLRWQRVADQSARFLFKMASNQVDTGIERDHWAPSS